MILLLNNSAISHKNHHIFWVPHCCSRSADCISIFVSVSANVNAWNSLRSQHSPECNIFSWLDLLKLYQYDMHHFLCFYIELHFFLVGFYLLFVLTSLFTTHFICEYGIYFEKKFLQMGFWDFFLCKNLGPLV